MVIDLHIIIKILLLTHGSQIANTSNHASHAPHAMPIPKHTASDLPALLTDFITYFSP